MMDATAIKIILICIAGAMICTSIRVHRPEIAAAVAFAIGMCVLLMTKDALSDIFLGFERFFSAAALENENASVVMKAAGITILAELGVQICCDAGETALAGRIRLAVRVVLLGMAMPMVFGVMDSLEGLLLLG